MTRTQELKARAEKLIQRMAVQAEVFGVPYLLLHTWGDFWIPFTLEDNGPDPDNSTVEIIHCLFLYISESNSQECRMFIPLDEFEKILDDAEKLNHDFILTFEQIQLTRGH